MHDMIAAVNESHGKHCHFAHTVCLWRAGCPAVRRGRIKLLVLLGLSLIFPMLLVAL